ncbi:MAG: hypothetical protein LUC20_03325, partial [Oscillospiraceae bacterium]|nr:hypothetical protein [Oscillospiraceae bacterium]
CTGLENAAPEAARAGGRPILLTPLGLRPPSVSKIDSLGFRLSCSRFFRGITSLTNEQHFAARTAQV